jgi:hypothetical protein
MRYRLDLGDENEQCMQGVSDYHALLREGPLGLDEEAFDAQCPELIATGEHSVDEAGSALCPETEEGLP